MFGVGSIPWSPLGRGLLTHPLKTDTLRSKSDAYVLRTQPIATLAHLWLTRPPRRFLQAFDIGFLPDLVGR